MKSLMLAFIVLCMTACVSVSGGSSGNRRVIMWQRGVVLAPFNMCTPKGKIFTPLYGVVADSVPLGQVPRRIAIPGRAFNDSRQIEVMFIGYAEDGKTVLGSVTRRFYVGEQTELVTWTIGGGGGSGYQDRVYDAKGYDVCGK